MAKNFLDDRRKSLEDEFFHKENKADIARFREKLAKQTTKDELRTASGMDDDAVLEKLMDMGLSAETITALSLVPLLKVAWADGEVQEQERIAILQGAKGKGIEEDSPGAELLAGWLDQKPDRKLYEAWADYIKTLRSELSDEQSQILRTQVTRFALTVAEAAGGFMGFRSVSKEEKDALEWIESVFDEEVEKKERPAAKKDGDGDGDGDKESAEAKADDKAEASDDKDGGDKVEAEAEASADDDKDGGDKDEAEADADGDDAADSGDDK